MRLLAITVTTLSVLILAGSASASEARQESWQQFVEYQFMFSAEIPSSWQVNPRSPVVGRIGEHIAIVDPEDGGDGRQNVIAIGHAMRQISDDMPLLDWVSKKLAEEAYLFGDSGSAIRPYAGRESSVHVSGSYGQTVYFKNGDVAWLVMANFGEDAGEGLNSIFRRLTDSVRFLEGSPQTLAEIYRLPMTPIRFVEADVRGDHPVLQTRLSSSYWSPVRNQGNGEPWDVHCGSAFHTNGSSYAADVDADYGTSVFAAEAGEVITVGNSSTGFGKYVVIKTGSYYHYYAHLSSILFYITEGYVVKRKGLRIGYVGDSGGVPPHLHFHIQDGLSHTNSNGVSLVGMTGFTATSSYPSGSWYCATMGR